MFLAFSCWQVNWVVLTLGNFMECVVTGIMLCWVVFGWIIVGRIVVTVILITGILLTGVLCTGVVFWRCNLLYRYGW